MIADSPYRTGEPALTATEGALAGLGASALMLLGVSLLRPLSGLSAVDLLVRIGQTVVPRAMTAQFGSMVFAAGVVYAAVGALLGVLYAASQDRGPARVLVAVGLFYGLVIWVGSRVMTSWLFGPAFRTSLHSYAWLVACLVYGAVLAGCAAWVDRRRPREVRVVPID